MEPVDACLIHPWALHFGIRNQFDVDAVDAVGISQLQQILVPVSASRGGT
jgi:hypothetical protein